MVLLRLQPTIAALGLRCQTVCLRMRTRAHTCAQAVLRTMSKLPEPRCSILNALFLSSICRSVEQGSAAAEMQAAPTCNEA